MAQFSSWQAYRTFSGAILRKNRYTQPPQVQEFLEALHDVSTPRQINLKKGRLLWRAQLGSDSTPIPGYEECAEELGLYMDAPFSNKRMKPLPDKAKEGRINPKGIPYLYLATSETVAVSEVRPWVGSKITLGKFRIVQDQKLAVFTAKKKRNMIYLEEPSEKEIKRSVWFEVCESFTKPVERDDDTADYAPSQVIAEYFKNLGFDGLAYPSAFSTSRLNVALFDIEAAELVNKKLEEAVRIDVHHQTIFP